jgi:trk system potassium uptake protein TrkA
MAQFAVIGLGNFGSYLALNLGRKGHDVLAMDKESGQVNEVREQIRNAVVADSTDKEALASLGVEDTDAAIVCIGSDMSASILTSLNLVELGTKRILAKAISEPHARILRRLGVSEVLFPEKDSAFSLAEKLHNPNMLEYLPLVEGYGIFEISPPLEFVGKPLKDLDLINRYGAQVLAIKEAVPDRMHLIPTGQFVIKDSDLLILLAPTGIDKKLPHA